MNVLAVLSKSVFWISKQNLKFSYSAKNVLFLRNQRECEIAFAAELAADLQLGRTEIE